MSTSPWSIITLSSLQNTSSHPPKKSQHCPFEPKPIQYDKQSDTNPHEEPSPPLDKDEKKYIQQVVGSFLYYDRAIDMTILLALSDIASQQANSTEKTMKRVRQLLDYMATHPEAKNRFCASDMILNVHSDVSFLSAAKGRSHARGCFFLGS